MKHYKFFLLTIISSLTISCITPKEVQYMQPSESLVLNEEGLVPYNIPEYRVTRNDIFTLNIVTTPKGDAAQFYSSFNTSGGAGGGGSQAGASGGSGAGGASGRSGGFGGNDARFYFNGLKQNSSGEIYIIGIGNVKAEGRLIEEIRNEIQEKVNENFLQDKTDVRLNIDGISYFILGDVETTGLTGEKSSYSQNLNIMEALAKNGGLNRTVDRKKITLLRRFPEGIKKVQLDLTREDIMNSPYFWIQNGDMIYLNTREKSFHGFGKDPLQTLGVSILTAGMSIFLLIKNL